MWSRRSCRLRLCMMEAEALDFSRESFHKPGAPPCGEKVPGPFSCARRGQVSVTVASRSARRGFCFSSRNQQMGPRPDRAGEMSPAPSHAVRARTLQICAQNQLDTRLLPVLRSSGCPTGRNASQGRPLSLYCSTGSGPWVRETSYVIDREEVFGANADRPRVSEDVELD